MRKSPSLTLLQTSPKTVRSYFPGRWTARVRPCLRSPRLSCCLRDCYCPPSWDFLLLSGVCPHPEATNRFDRGVYLSPVLSPSLLAFIGPPSCFFPLQTKPFQEKEFARSAQRPFPPPHHKQPNQDQYAFSLFFFSLPPNYPFHFPQTNGVLRPVPGD